MKRAFLAFLMLGNFAAYAADEITAAVTFRVYDNYIDIQRTGALQFSITNAAPNLAGDSDVLSTNAASALSIGSVAAKGWAWFRNLSATNTGNTISLGVVDASTNYIEFARLKPSEYALIRLGTSAIYGKSIGTNEASSRLEKLIVDD